MSDLHIMSHFSLAVQRDWLIIHYLSLLFAHQSIRNHDLYLNAAQSKATFNRHRTGPTNHFLSIYQFALSHVYYYAELGLTESYLIAST